MNDPTSLPPAAAPTGSPLHDALTLWGSESAPARPARLTTLRLDANERLVLFFTSSLARVQLHYLESALFRDYVHCAGTADCLLCQLQWRPDGRDLLPIYDVLERTVAVLPISQNIRPHALRPQLQAILRGLQRAGRYLVGIQRLEPTRFVVRTYPLLTGTDDGRAQILAFQDQLNAGHLDLGDVYRRQSREELAALPEIATLMQLRGIQA